MFRQTVLNMLPDLVLVELLFLQEIFLLLPECLVRCSVKAENQRCRKIQEVKSSVPSAAGTASVILVTVQALFPYLIISDRVRLFGRRGL